MAAPTVTQLQEGIRARLATITSLNGRTFNYWPDTINPPCAWVHFPAIPAYHGTMGMGWLEYDFSVYVAVGRQVDRAGQQALEPYISPAGASSVLVAIEGDTSLGGLSAVAMVADFRPLTIEEFNTIGAYGGAFTVHVSAQGV